MPDSIREEALNALTDLLIDSLGSGELEELSFRLGTSTMALAGDSGRAKIVSLVKYCESHYLVPKMVKQFGDIYPSVPVHASIIDYVAAIERHPRDVWLRLHGFETDPFPQLADKAEVDPLFEKVDTSSEFSFVVYPSNVDKILIAPISPPSPEDDSSSSDSDQTVVTPPFSGVRYIFAPAAAGKTTLRRHLFRQYADDLAQWYPVRGKPLVLPVEYVFHDYRLAETREEQHLRRIGRLMSEAGMVLLKPNADDLTDDDFRLDLAGPPDHIVDELAACPQRWGIDGICVLVDNLSGGTGGTHSGWQAIQPLVARTPDLAKIAGLSFRFFCPAEFLPFAREALAADYIHELTWTETNLLDVLDKRLAYCQKRDHHAIPGESAFATLFEHGVVERVREELVRFGLRGGGVPGEMWRLGNALLETHFSHSDRRQPVGRLIRYEDLDRAVATLIRREMAVPPAMPPAPDDRAASMLEAVERLIVAINSLTDAIRAGGYARPE